MSDARRNIKINGDVFTALNTARNEHDEDWNTFLQACHDARQHVETGETQTEDGDVTLSHLVAMLEEMQTTIPERTVRELQENFR
jgi:hypothetical protein